MFAIKEQHLLVEDREDLIYILRMRFGEQPDGLIEEIYQIEELGTLQRLILVAANAESFALFIEELRAGEQPAKLVGERFQPAIGGGETIG